MSDGIARGFKKSSATGMIYPRFLTRFGALIFTNASLAIYQVKFLVLFFHFSLIDGLSSSAWEVVTKFPCYSIPQDVILEPTLILMNTLMILPVIFYLC